MFRKRPSRRRHLTVLAYLVAFAVLGLALARTVDNIRSQPAPPATHTHDPVATTANP